MPSARPLAWVGMSILCFVLLAGCRSRMYVKSFDFDQDGLVDKVYHVQGERLLQEEQDQDHDGVLDMIIDYTVQGDVSSVSIDRNNDGRVDEREEYLNDMSIKSFRDDDGDGHMDRMWLTHYSPEGQAVLMEIDMNNDGIVDSKVNMEVHIQENRVHGRWYKDVQDGASHGVFINEKWHPIEFHDGEWMIVSSVKHDGI